MSRRSLWGVAAVCVLVRLPALWMSPSCDEAIFATVGNVWLRHGGLPYRDAVENKPPGVFLIYGLSRSLLGSEFAGPRALAALAAGWTGVSVARIAASLAGGAAGVVAGVAFGLLSAGAFTPMAYSDSFLLPFAAHAVVLALRGLQDPEASERGAAWAGLCLGAALLFKQVAVADAAAVALGFLWIGRGRRRRIGLLTVGLLVPVVLFAAYFWYCGILRDAYECIVGLLGSAATVREGLGIAAWRREAAKIGAITVPFAWGAVWLLGSRRAWPDPRRRMVLAAWLVFGLAAALGARRFAPNQLLQPLPALCALGGAGLGMGLGDVWRKGPAVRAATLLVALALVSAAFLQAPRYLRALARVSGRDQADVEARQIAQSIQNCTFFDDPIYVADLDSRIYVYADRRPAFRVFNVIFTRVPRLRRATVQALWEDPPKYLVVQPRRLGGDRLSWDDLAPLLRRSYEPVAGHWSVGVYRRLSTGRPDTR